MTSVQIFGLPRVSVPTLDIVSYISNHVPDAEIHELLPPHQLKDLPVSTVRRNIIVVRLLDTNGVATTFNNSLQASGDVTANLLITVLSSTLLFFFKDSN